MTDELIRKLIEWVETASPKLWSILIKQVYVDGMNYLVAFVVCLILALICYKLVLNFKIRSDKSAESYYHSDDYEFEGALSWIGVVFASILGVIFLVSALNVFINPEFYAIKWLIGSLGG